MEKVLEQDDIIARRVVALKDAHSRLETAFEAILAGEELEVTAPEPLPAGFYVTWRMAMAVGLAGAGIAAAVLPRSAVPVRSARPSSRPGPQASAIRHILEASRRHARKRPRAHKLCSAARPSKSVSTSRPIAT